MSDGDVIEEKRPVTFDHLKKKKPVEATVEILLDDEPSLAVRDARSRLLQAETALSENSEDEALLAERDAAKSQVDEALALMKAETVTLRFHSIGRKAWEALIDANPPTVEQRHAAKEEGNEAVWNSDTFPQALIAASCVEPVMSLEQVQELFDEWNTAESGALFNAAYAVNMSRRVPDLGNASGGTQF